MKWGLGLGVAGLIVGLGLALVPFVNLCAPVLALAAGGSAAYLAGREDPDRAGGGANGAKTGALTGAVMIPMFLGALLIALGAAAAGLAIGGNELTERDTNGLATTAGYGLVVFFGGAVLNLALGALGGLLGGLLATRR
jgi:hypothetical protein